MSIQDLLGRRATLRIQRLAAPGAFLDLGEHASEEAGELLLPGNELTHEENVGDELDVFVYLDSEDRPIATRRAPKLELGQIAFLEVTDLTPYGAFVDWGLPKELLVPFKEQTCELAQGELHPIALTRDKTGRLAGTMRIRELLRTHGRFEPDEWVEGEAWREEPGVGVFVIVERLYLGLVPASEPHRLHRAQATSFRVAHVQRDGKLELSVRGRVHEELAGDAQRILAKLSQGQPLRVSDKSSPEQLRTLFGLSKKAFKRAVGRLLKEGTVSLDADGFLVAKPRTGST